MRLEPLRYLEVEREEEEQNESSDSTFNFEQFTVNESQSFPVEILLCPSL